MKALFVELPAFERYRQEYLSDEAYRGLQNEMLKAPETGDVITGTGACAKSGTEILSAAKASMVGSEWFFLVGNPASVLAFHPL